MWSETAVVWVTLTVLGQWCLLFLLGTFAFVPSLPQRKNAFLINFLLTTFLSTIPSSLLFFTGQQGGTPPYWLCTIQSILMDGIAPMFGLALVVLVFQTWSELRAILLDKTYTVARSGLTRWLLLLAPYATLACWCAASLIAALQPTAQTQLSAFVFCASTSPGTDPVRGFIGYFMVACSVIELFFETWIGYLIVTTRSPRNNLSFVASYRTNVHMSMRILALSLLELTPIFLTVFVQEGITGGQRNVVQILESMNPIITFLVFGTQRTVLKKWMFWGKIDSSDQPEDKEACIGIVEADEVPIQSGLDTRRH